MKTHFKTISVVFFAISTFITSCSKSDSPAATTTPSYDIKGYYSGTYGNGSSSTDYGYVMILEAGGKFTITSGASKLYGAIAANIGYGTYTLSGNTFSGTYKYNLGTGSQFSLTATYDPTTGKMSNGTWGSGTANTGGGLWAMNRNITPSTNISGYWTGMYGGGTSTPTNSYTMVVENATDIIIADGASITGSTSFAYGAYTLTGTNFAANYKYNFGSGNQFSISAVFNQTDAKLINGTWGSGLTATGSGLWNMNKQL